MTKILVCVDESKNSEAAFDWYLSTIYKDCDEVIFVHVQNPARLPTVNFTGVKFPTEEILNIMTERNKRANALENTFTMKCLNKKIKFKFIMHQSEGGNPADHILKIAESEGAGFILMGTRGLGKIRRTILGSVSNYMVHHSTIPVLISPLSK